MINLGLSAADQRLFNAGLVEDHKIRVRVDLLALDHRVIVADCDVVSGQVDWDMARPIERTCTLELFDPGNALRLDDGLPLGVATFANRMVRVRYGVWSQQLPRWVDVPVFVGPISEVQRGENGMLTVNAEGKEALLLNAHGVNRKSVKGTRMVYVAEQLAADCGEKFIDIPYAAPKLTSDLQVAASTPTWPIIKSMVSAAVGRRAAYDGRGTLRSMPPAGRPVWVFKGGAGGSLVGRPKVQTKIEELRNYVVVTGGIPKGAKAHVAATVQASPEHPCSPANLGRNGKPRYLRMDVSDEAITTVAAAYVRGEQELAKALRSAGEVSLEALPVPHLEPGDAVSVDVGEWAWSFTATKGTLPLTPDGKMTIGRQYVVGRRGRISVRKGAVRPAVAKPKPKPKPKPRAAAKKKGK